MSWHNGGREGGKSLSDICVVPAPDGIIESRLPGYENCRCIPVKNIGGIKITCHCPITGAPIQVQPVYLTILEPIEAIKVEKIETESPKETA